MSSIEFDFSEFTAFFDNLDRTAKGSFKKELILFLEGLGNEFLRIVGDEIVRRKVTDSRQLLASFHKGDESNIWEIHDGGLSLEVGTSVDYAKYVEDGHWTNKKGVDRRFVPGYWEGDRFIYDPSAKSGMVLKQQWIEGKHYFQSALKILDTIYPGMLEVKLQEWLDTHFGI